MPRKLKELIVVELAERFRDIRQTGCVLVNFGGIKANEASAVRSNIRGSGGEMTVVTNSLFARAMADVGAEELCGLLKGPIAVIRAGNPVDAAKAAGQAGQLCPALEVCGGYADGSVIDVAAVQKLAEIPSREVLLSMIAGALVAPLRRLAFGLLAKPRALVNVIAQLRDKVEEEGE